MCYYFESIRVLKQPGTPGRSTSCRSTPSGGTSCAEKNPTPAGCTTPWRAVTSLLFFSSTPRGRTWPSRTRHLTDRWGSSTVAHGFTRYRAHGISSWNVSCQGGRARHRPELKLSKILTYVVDLVWMTATSWRGRSPCSLTATHTHTHAHTHTHTHTHKHTHIYEMLYKTCRWHWRSVTKNRNLDTVKQWHVGGVCIVTVCEACVNCSLVCVVHVGG